MHPEQYSKLKAASGASDSSSGFTPAEYGLTKAMYDVNETLEKLSIGRTSLYYLVGEGELTPTKFGKKTLFAAPDIAALLNRRRAATSVKEAA